MKNTITGWALDYGQNPRDIIHWEEGHAGVEYAVIDHLFKGKKSVTHNLPFSMKDRIKKYRITIEEIEEKK